VASLNPVAAVAAVDTAATSALTKQAQSLAEAASKQIVFRARPLVMPWRFIAVTALLVVLALVPVTLSAKAALWTSGAGLVLFGLATASVLMSSAQAFNVITRAGEPLITAEVRLKLLGRERNVRLEYGSLDLPQAIGAVVFFLLLRGLQKVGSTLIAASFFIFWGLVTMLVWGVSSHPCGLDLTHTCHAAYRGLGTNPRVGLFLYYAVFASVANNPPTLIANSSFAHAAVIAEVLLTLGVLGTAARFVGWPERNAPLTGGNAGESRSNGAVPQVEPNGRPSSRTSRIPREWILVYVIEGYLFVRLLSRWRRGPQAVASGASTAQARSEAASVLSSKAGSDRRPGRKR
jgi:hypothetical protein